MGHTKKIDSVTRGGSLAPERILVSSLISSAAAAHGGPVISRRQAAALTRCGFDVCVAAPSGEKVAGDPFEVEIYRPGVSPRDHFATKRYDATAVSALRRLIDKFRPDIVYDVHGPVWAVDAASQAGIPVVSMMGDYNWYCMQSFLVDSRLRRCSGPEKVEKCFSCVNKWHRRPMRAVNHLLKPLAVAGVATFPLWDRLSDSTEYVARMRERISRIVVGDRKAFDFLVEHGVPLSRIARIAQGLPLQALSCRRKPDNGFSARSRNLRLGFVGRADPDKGLQVLAHAFDSLPRDVPVELWIVHAREATADYLKGLFPSRRRFAGDLKSGRIKLLRPKSQDEVFEIMAQVDVGVVPSLAFESPCLALLEFVAQQTPIVRSESPGMEHVIQDAINGRTFPYGDSRALARIIREIVAEPGSLDRWRAALPRIASDDDYARQLRKVFEALCSSPETIKTEACHA